MTMILFNSSNIYEGEILNLEVATTYIDDFFKYAKLIPSMLNIGSISPLESLTLRQNNYGVFLMRSDLKSLFIMVSPLEDKKKSWEIILKGIFVDDLMII